MALLCLSLYSLSLVQKLSTDNEKQGTCLNYKTVASKVVVPDASQLLAVT